MGGRRPCAVSRPHGLHLSEGKNGSTHFQYTNEFHPPGGRLGNIASRMIVGATSEREAKKSLSALKSLLEKQH